MRRIKCFFGFHKYESVSNKKLNEMTTQYVSKCKVCGKERINNITSISYKYSIDINDKIK